MKHSNLKREPGTSGAKKQIVETCLILNTQELFVVAKPITMDNLEEIPIITIMVPRRDWDFYFAITLSSQTCGIDSLTPTEGYEDAIVIPEIAATNFELKHGLINLVQNKQFLGHDKEDPHAHIRYFNKITSTMRVSNVPNSTIKLMLFPFSLEGAARILLEKEPPRSILTWDDLVSKFINQFFPPSKTKNLRFIELRCGWNFLDKMPSDCLKIIESKSKVRQSRAKAVVAKVNSSSSTPAISSDVAELKDMGNQPPAYQAPAYQAPIPQAQNVSQTDFERYIKANDAVLRNIQSQGQSTQNQCQNVQNQLANLTDMVSKLLNSNIASSLGSGTLLGNTITNPKEDLIGITTRSGVVYQGPTIPTPSKVVKQRIEVIKDQVQTPSSQSTAPIQPLVAQSKTLVSEPVSAPVSVPMPNLKSSIPYPLRRDNERRCALIRNKEKLSEMARTPMNEHCSAVILNKLPKKLGDLGKFLIPCEFPGMDECLALADLGASINLMPLYVWEELSLSELTTTCMTLELADRLVPKPIGIAKDVKVKVGVFYFPADFVVVDFKPDPRVPLILGRCFLKTGRALIDVHKGELTLRIENEAITYNLDPRVCVKTTFIKTTSKGMCHKPQQPITAKETPVFDLRWLQIKFDLLNSLPFKIIKTMSIGGIILIKTEVVISTNLISTRANFIDPSQTVSDTILKHNLCELVIVEVCTAITNDGTGSSKPSKERFQEFSNNSGVVSGERFRFNIFRQVINGHEYILVPSWRRERPYEINAPKVKNLVNLDGILRHFISFRNFSLTLTSVIRFDHVVGITIDCGPIKTKVKYLFSGVVRAMMSPGGSIVESLKNVNGFLAVNTLPEDLILTNFQQEGVVPKVMLHIFEEFVLLLERHPIKNEVPHMEENPTKQS
nr:hypothetical protein [Tanacetum cinerariifolium]